MIELGQLERRIGDFDQRHVRIVAVSNDSQDVARLTQADFPHLTIVADTDQKMAKAIEVIHHGGARDGGDTNAPTTILVDGNGKVRLVYRARRFVERLSPDELLQMVDTAKLGK